MHHLCYQSRHQQTIETPTPPTMDLSVWRRRARIAAYIELLMSVWGLFYNNVYAVFLEGTNVAVNVTHHEDEITAQSENDEEDLDVITWIRWIIVFVLLTFDSMDAGAAILLLKATKQEENDHKSALGRAQTWKKICIGYFISYAYVPYNGVMFLCFLALEIVVRVIMIFVVRNFMSALKQAIQTPSDQFPPHFSELGLNPKMGHLNRRSNTI